MWLYLLIAAVALFLWWFIGEARVGARFSSPGPWGHTLPLSPAAVKFVTDIPRSHEWFLEQHKHYGDTYHMNMFGRNMVITRSVPLIRVVMRERGRFPLPDSFRDALTQEMGPSMFASEGDEWQRKHRALQPLVSHGALKHNTVIVYNKVAQFVRMIPEMPGTRNNDDDGVDIDITPWLKRLALDVIGDIAFGKDLNALEGKDHVAEGSDQTFSRVFEAQLDAINARSLMASWLYRLLYYMPLFRKEREAAGLLRSFFLSLLNECAGKLAVDDDSVEHTNLLSLMLSTQRSNSAELVYSPESMLGEAFSIMGAAHDTTTTTMSFLLKNLAQHQRVQDRLRDEIMQLARDTEAAGDGAIPSYAALTGLPYMGAVIKESTRLYPPVNALIRTAANDEEIEGVKIAKAGMVVIHLLAVQRSKEVYGEDAEEYRPERWLHEKGERASTHADDLYTYLTFGAGTRMCYGKKFAMLEMRMVLYQVLQHYRLVDDKKPLEIYAEFGVRPIKGSTIRFQRLR